MSGRLALKGGLCGGAARAMSELAARLAGRGWAEASAGNISVCLPAGTAWPRPCETRTVTIPEPVPELEGRSIALTATGSRMRDLGADCGGQVVFVRIGPGGSSWDGPERPAPTSELAVHLMAHRTALALGMTSSAVVHAHPASVVALSMAPLPSPRLDEMALAAHPEVRLLMRGGIRFLDYLPPGSPELGRATSAMFLESDCVVWRGHGVAALGADLDCALDSMEIAEKAASIILMRSSAFGGPPPGRRGAGGEEEAR